MLRDKDGNISGGRVIRLVVTLAAVGMALLFASCSISAHSVTVKPGEVGVMVRTLGADAGVDPKALPPGWHFTGIGEQIVQFPTIERSYAYTRGANADSATNEEISFSDHTGLPMTADVQIVLRVLPQCAPRLYQTWRLDFDQLFTTPIRNDVRSAVAAESELIPVDQMYSGGRQGVIQRALARVQRKWAPQCVEITQLDWLGNIRYPDSVLAGITAKSQVEQATLAAQGRVAQAKAEADARIEQARGEAESIRLKGEALRASPEVVQQIYAQRSMGLCPPAAHTCIIGANAWSLVPEAYRQGE
jgi:regulator of protease activity HflC (stomatin/prohibitin superfamily)